MDYGRSSRFSLALVAMLLLGLRFASLSYSQQEAKKDAPAAKKDLPAVKKELPPAKKAPIKKEVANPSPPQAWLKSDAWKDVPTTALQTGEIDRLLENEFNVRKVVLAPPTTDEQFLRRVCLDLTGQLPTTAEIEEFLADKSADKRSQLINKLLDSEAYAQHWARYWRDTVTAVEAPFGNAHVPAFKDWLVDQFKQNRNWGEIVRAMLTAEGSLKRDDPDRAKYGAIFFLGRFTGPDSEIFQTAETARLFLGIQIQCAQCHDDRRTKIWHQVQFHELAGFFARIQAGGSSGSLIKLNVKPFGEHAMPSRDPNLQYITHPRFLDGQAPAKNAVDADRRKALADFLTSPDNYWFSAAFANRMCNELLGQSFFERVDDLSPKSELVHPPVINRLAASFKGSQYDIKALLRAIANSKAYQRQVRVGEALNEHLQFAAVYPARLRADVLWQELSRVLVNLPVDSVRMKPFMDEFDYDPSIKSDEVTGSMSQALWLLNSNLVNERVKIGDVSVPPPPKNDKEAQPVSLTPAPTLLKQLLAKHGSDDAAVLRDLYLRTLARKPTDRELRINLEYVKDTQQPLTRTHAFEDIFKVLINSTEFQRRR